MYWNLMAGICKKPNSLKLVVVVVVPIVVVVVVVVVVVAIIIIIISFIFCYFLFPVHPGKPGNCESQRQVRFSPTTPVYLSKKFRHMVDLTCHL